MVVKAKETLSPYLSSWIQKYAQDQDLIISKPAVILALDFLKEHTSLPMEAREEVIQKAIATVHLKGKFNSNYEGDHEVDPKSIGREVVLMCSENGIKIKRTPESVKQDVKDKYDGFDQGALDSTYSILNFQPDLCAEDKKYIVLESLNDTFQEMGDSFDGNFNYEAFGRHVNSNVAHVRKAKKAGDAVDHLMEMYANLDGNDDNYEDNWEDAFEYYDEKYNFSDDDFEEYADALIGSDNYEDNFESEYFGKKKEERKERRAAKKEARKEKKAAKKEKRADKKAARKEKRKERGSLIGNILTGGVLGATKKVKAKHEAKKAAKAVQAGLADTANAVDQDQAAPETMSAATDMAAQAQPAPPQWPGDSISIGMPTPPISSATVPAEAGGGSSSGGGGSSGGGSGSGGGAEFDESDEDSEEEEEGEDEDSQEDLEESDDESWEENDQEVANFFGYKKSTKVDDTKGSSLFFEGDNFEGDSKMTGGKVIVAIVLISIAVWAFIQYKKIK